MEISCEGCVNNGSNASCHGCHNKSKFKPKFGSDSGICNCLDKIHYELNKIAENSNPEKLIETGRQLATKDIKIEELTKSYNITKLALDLACRQMVNNNSDSNGGILESSQTLVDGYLEEAESRIFYPNIQI